MWSKLTCLTLLFALANCNYNGYKVFQTEDIHSQSKAIELIKFIESADEGVYDFWVSPRVGSYAKVMVAPGHVSEFEKFLKEKSIASTLLIEDVEITNQRAFIVENILRKFKTSSRSIDFENYYSSDDIFAYLHELEADNDFVEVETYGKSYEGRDLKVIKILKAGPNAPNIFIEAGIHAREWIAPAMGTYIIHSLLEDPENARYLDQFNFHIMPSVNPDGYEYSREYERLWRKTRSRNQETSCRGVDPNRNWGYHWNETSVSNNPCSDIFPGLKPFSELETDAIRQYVEKLQSTPLMSLSLHTYGTRREGSNLYPASGASDDWYLGVLGSTYAYTVELRQGGNLGFDLPPSEIKESGEELWAGMKVIFDRLHEVSSQ
ncbi:unnamed protein product [Lepeophtheirus salmonis]|uniref:(salmon louse) hypothetical protein n=1 Tax=Lepeophtheirus salmonis TaxID=72036 RepID=A0A7R8CEW0_LEPSM|nr:unnamed protein product [Lepeophtheirus salmonis]CAF2794819.1 unnamed protein product [Lepeophtheirus salmonis]